MYLMSTADISMCIASSSLLVSGDSNDSMLKSYQKVVGVSIRLALQSGGDLLMMMQNSASGLWASSFASSPRSRAAALPRCSHAQMVCAVVATAALTAQVPSCCVLTSLGMSVLPGSRPGGAAFTATLQQAMKTIQQSNLNIWGQLTLEVDGNATAAAAGKNADRIQDTFMQLINSVTACKAFIHCHDGLVRIDCNCMSQPFHSEMALKAPVCCLINLINLASLLLLCRVKCFLESHVPACGFLQDQQQLCSWTIPFYNGIKRPLQKQLQHLHHPSTSALIQAGPPQWN
jgi:hypothetical protein